MSAAAAEILTGFTSLAPGGKVQETRVDAVQWLRPDVTSDPEGEWYNQNYQVRISCHAYKALWLNVAWAAGAGITNPFRIDGRLGAGSQPPCLKLWVASVPRRTIHIRDGASFVEFVVPRDVWTAVNAAHEAPIVAPERASFYENKHT